MENTGLGGGIMLAIAAGLWMLYLVPSMLRRATMSESDREAKRLEQQERARARLDRAEAASAGRGATSAGRGGRSPVSRPAPRAHRIRRARSLSSLVLLSAIVVLVVQLVLVATTGVVPGSVLVLAAALLAGVSALAMLGQLGRASRSASAASVRVAHPLVDHAPIAAPVVAPWTPVPMPKPLYLERAAQQPAVASETLVELRAAAAAAERALRMAQESPEVVPIARPAASRFASMGIVDPRDVEQRDLDEVLRRRRAVG